MLSKTKFLVDSHGNENNGIPVLAANAGRPDAYLLALYAFAVFGYVTATIATCFMGPDEESSGAELAGTEDVRTLRKELQSWRTRLQDMSQQQSWINVECLTRSHGFHWFTLTW